MEGPHDPKAILQDVIGTFAQACDIDILRQFLDDIAKLDERLKSDEIRVAFLGQMKRGKSSLINALLEDELLPSGVLPLTAIVTEITRGDRILAQIGYQSGRVEEVDTDDLAGFLTEAGNPGNCKRVAIARISYPNPLLDNHVVLVDTPGIGSTYAHNSDTTENYLKKVDVAVVVTSVDPPLTKVESDFIQKLQPEIPKLIFVINKTDLVSAKDLACSVEFLQSELRDRLGIQPDKIFPVSTKTKDLASLRYFSDNLSEFLRTSHDQTLVTSIGSDLRHHLRLSRFRLKLGSHAAAAPPQLIDLWRIRLNRSIEKTTRELQMIRALLIQERTDILDQLTADLKAQTDASTAQLESELAQFKQTHTEISGTEFGNLLQNFVHSQIELAFDHWRTTEDGRVSNQLAAVSSHYVMVINKAIWTLLGEVADIFSIPYQPIMLSCSFTVGSRITYKVDEVFYSLDRFLLLLPGPLQRLVVFRRTRKQLKNLLDRNAGRIRFDYLERLEKSFEDFEKSIAVKTNQIINILADIFDISDSRDTMECREKLLVELEKRVESLINEIQNKSTITGDGVHR